MKNGLVCWAVVYALTLAFYADMMYDLSFGDALTTDRKQIIETMMNPWLPAHNSTTSNKQGFCVYKGIDAPTQAWMGMVSIFIVPIPFILVILFFDWIMQLWVVRYFFCGIIYVIYGIGCIFYGTVRLLPYWIYRSAIVHSKWQAVAHLLVVPIPVAVLFYGVVLACLKLWHWIDVRALESKIQTKTEAEATLARLEQDLESRSENIRKDQEAAIEAQRQYVKQLEKECEFLSLRTGTT